MLTPVHQTVLSASPAGFHRIAYREWGDPANPHVVVAAHGMVRTGADFDVLASALAPTHRVVCPDFAGRGGSDWLADGSLYTVEQYVTDMVALLARLRATSVTWVGTSLGGIVGMAVASLPNSPVQRLVLNDVGPVLEPASMMRLAQFLADPQGFADLEQAIAYVRQVSYGFGEHTPEQWRKLALDVLRRNPDGTWVRNYDYRLAAPILATTPEQAAHNQARLWAAFDAIACPTLLLRGADSDMLSAAVAAEMCQRGPKPVLAEFAGVGHAPTLMAQDQVDVVVEFIRKGGAS